MSEYDLTNFNKLAVMIPVHKARVSLDEKVSLKACQRHLKNYNCFLVYPEGMDTTAYTSLFDSLILKPVPVEWLASVEDYNKMKLSVKFYELFKNYTHMLTYELDAYIFNSDFKDVKLFDFDFIGAPFFQGYWAAKPNDPFINGCNSGFSVRNINSCLLALNSMKKYKMHWRLYKFFLSPFYGLQHGLNKFTKYKYQIFLIGQLGFYFSDLHLNEDLVWTVIIPDLFPAFKIADPISSTKFSFEYNPEKLLTINGGKLPLGCHAWYKNYDFWQKYISLDELTY